MMRRRKIVDMSSTLYVTNLAYSTTESELKQLFTQAGRVLSLQLDTDPRSLAGNRYGVVEMETPEMTQTVMEQVNHQVLHERKMKIVELHEAR